MDPALAGENYEIPMGAAAEEKAVALIQLWIAPRGDGVFRYYVDTVKA